MRMATQSIIITTVIATKFQNPTAFDPVHKWQIESQVDPYATDLQGLLLLDLALKAAARVPAPSF